MDKETLYTIALTQMKGLSKQQVRHIYQRGGSATALFENPLQDIIPDANPKLISLMQAKQEPLRRAEQEAELIGRKSIECITMKDERYPLRLKECDDAPIAVYFCGKADLNRPHIISMVGTRQCTPYGRDICHQFIGELKELDPDILIVSGLAYGIDICTHREALANGMDTVGVLAHGLEKIYPSLHRNTAAEMTTHGGLLTEYMTGTTMDRSLFVQRNRIVAGLSDVTIVVESAEKGGSLITANIAHSYQREVLAFPGRIFDKYSCGCNRIIQNEMARPLRSADDLFAIMNWKPKAKEKKAMQQELFVSLTTEEQAIVNTLKTADDMPINQIVSATGISYSSVSVLLFEMENKGLVEFLGSTRYRLLRKDV